MGDPSEFTARERELRNEAYEQGQADVKAGMSEARLDLAKAFAVTMLENPQNITRPDKIGPQKFEMREIAGAAVILADALLDELVKPRGGKP